MQLREAFESVPDLKIVWVMSDMQVNDRTRAFVDELGLANRVLFLSDPKSRLIQDLGILKPDPEPMERGVPHPTTVLLDRSGMIRFIDVRTDLPYLARSGSHSGSGDNARADRSRCLSCGFFGPPGAKRSNHEGVELRG